MFLRYMQEKLAITVLVITLALFTLVIILYDLMTKKKDEYNQIVLFQQEYDSRTIPFKRGNIVDRNGTCLAASEKVYNLILDPKQIMTKPDSYLEASVTALVDCFGYDRTEILNLIQEKKEKQYICYVKGLSYEDKQKYEDYKKEHADELKKNKKSIKGIWFEDRYKRVYPYNSTGCSVIGFTDIDGLEGFGGIEQFYNTTLIGTNGREYGYLNSESNLERVIKPASNGCSVVSTIDVNVQKIVEKYIDEWEQMTGSKRIGVIVMDPNNGEILAMADDKTFDLNNPRTLRPEYTNEVLYQLGIKEAMADYKRNNIEALPLTEADVPKYYTNEKIISFGTMVAWNQTWRNYCISDGFEPGSTEKIFTVAAALEEGAITGRETYECRKFLEVGVDKINCSSLYGHGPITVEEGLAKSCNVVMMRIAQQIGKEKFYKYQQLFGFGSKTGIDLPGEADNKTLVYNQNTAGPTDLATNSFGQNFNTTMIQMAAAYCSVINGGSYYEPHVVKQILNEQNSVVKKVEPVLVRETVSVSTSKFINEALRKAVNETGGTGTAAKVTGYEVAGKTGTAEKIPRDKTNYVVSFCGYAPADNPKVLVYVVIDEPHVADQAHSTYASQVFQKIMSETLPYLDVFSDTEIEASSLPDAGILPDQEGITSETENSSQEETEEALPEEYTEGAEGDGNFNLPAALPTG